MNNYGMRWLMPFVDRWFYGDALFIVDPWIWGTLALGAGLSFVMRRRHAEWWTAPARAALVALLAYTTAMFAMGQAGRSLVARQLEERGVRLARTPMVAPIFADPLRRYVVADTGDRYLVAQFRWWPRPVLETSARVIPRGDQHPAVAAARKAPEARGFLRWTRFPFYTVVDIGDAFLVTMDDARYAPRSGTSWAAARVRVPKQEARP
jgi:inner membrane protein